MNGVLIAVADEPTGPFKWHQKISMLDRIGTPNTGDQTVFTDDETGKSYLVYSYERGRNKIYLSEISIKYGKVEIGFKAYEKQMLIAILMMFHSLENCSQ